MPFGHKAGLPPSKKYLLMRQPLSCERKRKSRRKLLKAKRMPGQTRRTGYKKIMCRIQKFPVGSTKENSLLFNGKSRMIYIDITE